MKKIILIIFSVIILSACNSSSTTSDNLDINKTPTSANPTNMNTTLSPSQNFTQSTVFNLRTSKGDILLKLYPDVAPNTVKNFIKKAQSGFYTNLTFHRVVPDFVIQGGDPLGNGTGGGNIPSEINSTPFKVGSLGLARGGDIKVSNDSQFFICLTTEMCSSLSNQYVNFGEVIEGMDVVKNINIGDKILEITADTK